MKSDTTYKKENDIELPDELWTTLLETSHAASKGIITAIRLFSGEIIDGLMISNRGYILGRLASGLAGAHGTIDRSMLTFDTDNIEAVLVPSFCFWRHSKWISLNPRHPARLRWKECGGRRT